MEILDLFIQYSTRLYWLYGFLGLLFSGATPALAQTTNSQKLQHRKSPSISSRSPASVALDSQQSPLICNGNAQFCNRLYSELSYPSTHNAQSYIPTLDIDFNLSFIPLEWLNNLSGKININVNDQNLTVTQQLEDGIRAMKLRTMPDHGKPYVCHGLNSEAKGVVSEKLCNNLLFQGLKDRCNLQLANTDPCIVDPAAVPLSEILATINKFLQSHLEEVVTLFLEDHVNDFESLTQSLQESGTASYTYKQDANQPWPTLREMIQANKRLVVFITRDTDKNGKSIQNYSHFNSYEDFVWSSRYHFENVSELYNDAPQNSDLTGKAFVDRLKEPKNKLWILQHFITPLIAGSPFFATQVNQAPFLHERLTKYQKVLGTKPNFVWVDFYELPARKPGYLDVIHQLNL